MDIIENILPKLNSENSKIIKSLSEIICFNKFKTIEELEKYENDKFNAKGNFVSTKERIDYCLSILESSAYDYDQLEYDEIQIYKKLLPIVKGENNSDEDRIKSLIILFNITHRELLFVTEAYKYIIDDKL